MLLPCYTLEARIQKNVANGEFFYTKQLSFKADQHEFAVRSILNWDEFLGLDLEKAVYWPHFVLPNMTPSAFEEEKNLNVNWENALLASVGKSLSNGN